MDATLFFEQLEGLRGKKIPGHYNLVVTYVTGEKETFEFNVDPRVDVLFSAKERKQYFFCQNNLINMNHVVKIQFQDLNKK